MWNSNAHDSEYEKYKILWEWIEGLDLLDNWMAAAAGIITLKGGSGYTSATALVSMPMEEREHEQHQLSRVKHQPLGELIQINEDIKPTITELLKFFKIISYPIQQMWFREDTHEHNFHFCKRSKYQNWKDKGIFIVRWGCLCSDSYLLQNSRRVVGTGIEAGNRVGGGRNKM